MDVRRVVLPVHNEGTTPLTVRIEPIGLPYVVAPGEMIYVLAKGPASGNLEVERSEGEVAVYGWEGSQVAFSTTDPYAIPHDRGEPDIDETIDSDSGSFLRRLTAAFAGWTPAHCTVFAALVAERHRHDLRDYADWPPGSVTALEMIDVLWDAAEGNTLTAERAEALESTLQQLGVLVDPDRLWSFDVYRGIRVLSAALRCSATSGRVSSPLDVALLGLAASAGTEASPKEIPQKLNSAWSWQSVQTEARWLNRAVAALSALSKVDSATVRELRDAFARLEADAALR
jgi:hypothetical protein